MGTCNSPLRLKQTVVGLIEEVFGSSEPIRYSRHRAIAPWRSNAHSLLIVTHGSIMLEAVLPDGQRQVLGFRFPGDLLCTALSRHLPDSSACAITDVQLIRIDHAAIGELARKSRALGQALVAAAAMQTERVILHNLVLGRLNVDQRVASFLLEMVLRCGTPMVDRVAFPMPMTRDDIGDYLGLNAASVSRALSRFRKDSLYGQTGQCEAWVGDVSRLEAETPLAKALNDRYGRTNRTDLGSLLARLDNSERPVSSCVHSFTLSP